MPSGVSKCAIGGGVGTESSQPPSAAYELRDVVEPALAKALVLAAEAEQWGVVAQIARELQARRESRAGKFDETSPTTCGRRSSGVHTRL
jgi:hypothetical protein